YIFNFVICLYFFFFFQAEDGIRDRNVTGVQTCALPILAFPVRSQNPYEMVRDSYGIEMTARKQSVSVAYQDNKVAETGGSESLRSEERRVGKECRSRRGQ